MPTDLELTTDRDIRIDATGDFAKVRERDNIRQQHANAIFRAADNLSPGLLDQNAAEDLRINVERELDNLSYVDSHSVEVEIDRPDTLTVTIDTQALEDQVVEEVIF